MTTENPNIVDLSTPLTVFNATEAAIQKLKDDYSNLTIAGINDKDGYKAVSEGLRILVSLRNKIDKRRLDIKRSIDNSAKDVLAQLTPIEAHLSSQKKTIDDELARIKQEKAEAERLRFVARTNRLFELGFTFNGVIYTLGLLAAMPSTINEANDEEWNTFIADAEAVSKQIAEKKAAEEAERLRLAEENERLRRELEAKNAVETNLKTMKQQGAIADGKVESVEVSNSTTTVNTSVQFNKPAQSIKIPVVFQDNVNTSDEPAPAVPYVDGFNACRAKTLEYLNNPAPISRKQLIEYITNLKP